MKMFQTMPAAPQTQGEKMPNFGYTKETLLAEFFSLARSTARTARASMDREMYRYRPASAGFHSGPNRTGFFPSGKRFRRPSAAPQRTPRPSEYFFFGEAADPTLLPAHRVAAVLPARGVACHHDYRPYPRPSSRRAARTILH